MSESPASAATRPAVAVVGTGPRGLAVLEAMAAQLIGQREVPLDIYAIDRVEVGCGRIWRTDQPEWFLTNTVAREVTMFSGDADDGPVRPGAGPSFAEWWARVAPDAANPDGFAPRRQYGKYLKFVLKTIELALPSGTRLHRVRSDVTDLISCNDGRQTLRLVTDGEHGRTSRELTVDRVVLTTGHPARCPDAEARRLMTFANNRRRLLYVQGDSPADMPLDELPPDRPIGVLGLGLAFYDVMAALTIGRAGRFIDDGTELQYVPSGSEPTLIAGSRSGVPFLARGRNQKRNDDVYIPKFLTLDLVTRLRRRGHLDFQRDVLPGLVAEMRFVYYSTAARQRYEPDTAAQLRGRLSDTATDPRANAAVVHEYGLDDLPELNLTALARPFAGRTFPDPEAFTAAVVQVIETDLHAAALGNVDGPLKAALDVIRDMRNILRAAIDFGGLHPLSHERDLIAWWTPISSQLSAGPPLVRVRQLLALIRSGVLQLVGPNAQFDINASADRFRVWSTQVGGSTRHADAIIDARIPPSGLAGDESPLISGLRKDGVLTSYVNNSIDGRHRFDTGGVAITRHQHHPVQADGFPNITLHVLGIPTENVRWFTQVGSGRPGRETDFTADARTVASTVLTALCSEYLTATLSRAG